MHLDFESRSTHFEDSKAEVEQVGKDWTFKCSLLHLSKPARYPAVERIVVPALKMRLRGKRNQAAFGKTQDSVTPTAVASTVSHIGVRFQPIPTLCKSGPGFLIERSEQLARRLLRGGSPAEQSDTGNHVTQIVSQSGRTWR